MNYFLKKMFMVGLPVFVFFIFLNGDEDLRDPFEPPQKTVVLDYDVSQASQIKLLATMQCDDERKAVVSNGGLPRLIEKGDVIWGWQVTEIEEGRVILGKEDGAVLELM